MNKDLLEKIGRSILRIVAVLAIIPCVAAVVYLFWQPGSDEPLPEYSNNAIWLGHGWLGDDSWFIRNKRDKEKFRSIEKISELFKKLSDNKIHTVYPHLCPAQNSGRIALYDREQLERFLDIATQYDIKVVPWVGGVFEESAFPEDNKWRKNFVDSVDELLKNHPRLSGVQVNIEPWPSYNVGFLMLLDELRLVTKGKILSVAAYPPPTLWHQFPDLHWRLVYLKRLTEHCDQLTVMMYDTSILLEKFYIKLMRDWANQLLSTARSASCELLLGIPAYEDAGVGYHHPDVENISSALRGISASESKKHIKGIAVYCEWEMDDSKWKLWRKFIR